jgi:hypothetical protein
MRDQGLAALPQPHTRLWLPDDPTGTFECHQLWAVLIFHLLSADEATSIIAMAEAHAEKHGWMSSRHRHYPTTDIAVEPSSAVELHSALDPLVRQCILPTMATHYGFLSEDLAVHDLFVVKYEAAGAAQDRLAPHRDGHLLSFSLLLSDPDTDFEGGGLAFHSLGPRCDTCRDDVPSPPHLASDQRVIRENCPRCFGSGRLAVPGVKQGDLTVHCGKLLHASLPVSRGTRYIVVGFVSVSSARVDSAFVESGTLANTSSVGAWADYEILEECIAPMDSLGPSASEPSPLPLPLQRAGLCVKDADGKLGLGLFTARPFRAGEVLLREKPLVAMLEFDGGVDPASHCSLCLRELVGEQLEGTCWGSAGGGNEQASDQAGTRCSAWRWCSPECREASEARGHSVLCPGRSEHMRAYHETAEEACNEYFLLAARLFASPAASDVSGAEAAMMAAIDDEEGKGARGIETAVQGVCGLDGHPLPSPRASSTCAGLKGVPWWLTVNPPNDPEQARAHYDGARALTELQCERLSRALAMDRGPGYDKDVAGAAANDASDDGEGTLTPPALALAMGVIRMNAVGVCVDSSNAEGATASGMGLFEILGRVNHSCVPNARLESLAGESEAAGATLAATRDVELGEEVLIDYLANFEGTAAEKREHLLEQYRFHCHCELCAAKG